jgi:hypothetical protein
MSNMPLMQISMTGTFRLKFGIVPFSVVQPDPTTPARPGETARQDDSTGISEHSAMRHYLKQRQMFDSIKNKCIPGVTSRQSCAAASFCPLLASGRHGVGEKSSSSGQNQRGTISCRKDTF